MGWNTPEAHRGWKSRAALFAAALWWGSLTAIGFVVVPLLFAQLPTSAQAGQMAARLFTAQTWIGLGCAMVLMMASRTREEPQHTAWSRGALTSVIAGALAALLIEFAVAPRIMARDNLRLWHGLGSGMFILQWLCAGAVLWILGGRSNRT